MCGSFPVSSHWVTRCTGRIYYARSQRPFGSVTNSSSLVTLSRSPHGSIACLRACPNDKIACHQVSVSQIVPSERVRERIHRFLPVGRLHPDRSEAVLQSGYDKEASPRSPSTRESVSSISVFRRNGASFSTNNRTTKAEILPHFVPFPHPFLPQLPPSKSLDFPQDYTNSYRRSVESQQPLCDPLPFLLSNVCFP